MPTRSLTGLSELLYIASSQSILLCIFSKYLSLVCIQCLYEHIGGKSLQVAIVVEQTSLFQRQRYSNEMVYLRSIWSDLAKAIYCSLRNNRMSHCRWLYKLKANPMYGSGWPTLLIRSLGNAARAEHSTVVIVSRDRNCGWKEDRKRIFS